ncbi:MAG: cobaltochelatase subunit CobN [Pyrinomonadaceae bacterium]|nr:cobaltochelatase subunit CobN [Pyrinomonadaceae bacterium]MBA3568538.1 cobaltochelatase subunit CobN [Pyrinomonadaceae bacterium]
MQVTVLNVGSSLLAPLKNGEREINREYKLDLRVAAYNFGSPLNQIEWSEVDHDLAASDVVFVIHVMDGENAARLIPVLERYRERHHAVIVINCMPELMRRTRMGSLDVGRFFGNDSDEGKGRRGLGEIRNFRRAVRLFSTAGSWVSKQVGGRTNGKPTRHGHGQYLKLIDKLPNILRFVPTAGTLRDVKNYLYIFCYFLQPTPRNIRSMILFALKHYVPDGRLRKLKIDIPAPEAMPSVAIYHPEAPKLFETFEAYRKWYSRRSSKSKVQSPKSKQLPLDAENTVGLLLMRPQVVSKTTKHYDALIHAIEGEGLSVIPAISTIMDNREACEKFFIDTSSSPKSNVQSPTSKIQATDNEQPTTDKQQSRVSQIVSLTGFSFVGGPAMNDSLAASTFLTHLNRPYRSAVSLDTQSIEAWYESLTGLNPIQAGMQIAIPEIDGATEPFVYGGISATDVEPVGLEDRCQRLARRLRRANRLRRVPRSELKLALVLFCFPPNKGNIGTAADLDVFPSVWDTLKKLKADGYDLELPPSSEELRKRLLGGNSETLGATANIAYRMDADEYRRLCPYVDEIEPEWGRAPGRINSFGNELLIQGLTLGKLFIGVQPTFGYEGDPMRLMMARGGAPHHGFMAFYTYLSRVLNVDAVIHVGTHGALEFMPGKQVGLSGACWPDRLVGELPNIYIYSVNNPSEGSIAKRRSYAELISYLTPPVENAGLYRELATLKDLLLAYRQATDERERASLFDTIEECSRTLNFEGSSAFAPLGARRL